MKNLIICSFFSVFSFFNLSGQGDWNLGGNNISSIEWFGAGTASDIPVSFEHRADDDALSFIWSTTTSTTLLPRMILTRSGWLGLNTTSPNCLYEVLDGSVMFRNSLSALDLDENWPLPPITSVPFSGGGIRLMWLEKIGALRAGITGVQGLTGTGSWWDAPNIGLGSIALGIDVGAFDEGTVAIGSYTQVEGHSSASVGLNNSINGNYSYAFGAGNLVSNTLCSAFGLNNTVNGQESTACGTNISVQGDLSFGFGVGISWVALRILPLA